MAGCTRRFCADRFAREITLLLPVILVLVLLWAFSFACIPHLLLLNKRPTATLAWLWGLLLFPGLGAILYLAVGTERVRRRRRRRQRSFRRQRGLGGVTSPEDGALHRVPPDSTERRLIETSSRIIGLPTDSADEIQLLRNGRAYYDALRKKIAEAQASVHVESFIWRRDEVGAEFLELLIAAARRGVRVRLLLDELGCLGLTQRYFRGLVEAGGEFSWCHTLYPRHNRYFFNLRNHRKLQVIDSRVAFVGGMNFGREYLGLNPSLGSWSDLQVELSGPVVTRLQQVFAEDWFFATGREHPLEDVLEAGGKSDLSPVQVLRTGPDEDDQPMLRINLALIEAVRRRLWISAGYFIPGGTMESALQVARARGVDVRLLVSEKSEHPLLVKAGRSYYDALLRQGVRIFEYRQGIEHSKYTVLDDDLSVIGSSNFDDRSMRLNFELSVLIHRRATNHALARIFHDMSAESQEIKRKSFSRRPVQDRLVESALRLASPLL
jgi:cardiolipin synthase